MISRELFHCAVLKLSSVSTLAIINLPITVLEYSQIIGISGTALRVPQLRVDKMLHRSFCVKYEF